MTPWSDFYNYVLPYVPGVGTDVADFAIRGAAIDFCEDTQIDQADLTAVDLSISAADYTLAPPSDQYDIVQVMSVRCDDHWLTPKTIDDLVRENGEYWPEMTAVTPRNFTQKTQDTLTVFPLPTTAVTGALKVRVAMRPDIAASGMTDWVANRYRRDIAAGAIAELMDQPSKPWSNPERAKVYNARFLAATSNALADRIRSFTRGSLQVNFRRGY